MRKKWTVFSVFLLTFLFGVGTWFFADGVREQIWSSSIRTITENTHQGANALNLQLVSDFEVLEKIWENIGETYNSNDLLSWYKETDPSIMLYFTEDLKLQDKNNDEAVKDFLSKTTMEFGMIDSHINSMSGEKVFNIFVRGALADGMEAYLVKEYHTKEIADQFTLSFYNNAGFSYLVNRNGEIMVRYAHKNSNKTNNTLFEMISGQGNDEIIIEKFKKSIYNLRTGWAKFNYEDDKFLFCYEPLWGDSDWLLVSIVPESVITGQTAQLLRWTLLFVGLVAVIILIIVAIFYVNKMRENELHTKELEEALEIADQANQAKGRFLMDMSHDVRTPLNAILGMVEVAKKNPDKEKIDDCLKKIEVSGLELLSLVSNVLDMSQIEQGKLILKEETISLSKLFEDTVELIRHRAQDLGLILKYTPAKLEHNWVTGDPLRIRQIMLNIISNAVKYTPSGGTVTLNLTEVKGSEEGTGCYRFYCKDTGIGINPEFQKRMFLPFERERNTTASKISGIGAGLTITKNLLDLMTGTIHVESQPDQGALFTIEFHFKIEEDPRQEEALDMDSDCVLQSSYDQKRVLLVEDNEINMEIMEELLSMTGVQIEKAVDGQEAVQLVQSKPSGYYNLIFMDIQMPVMDGYEATRQIRGMDRQDAGKIPIFALSANALAQDVENSKNAGMNGHIAKPIDMGPIENVMRQYLS